MNSNTLQHHITRLVIYAAMMGCVHAQDAGLQLKLENADPQKIVLGPAQPPFGPMATFKVDATNSAENSKALVVCAVKFAKEDEKESWDLLVFHELQIPSGKSTQKVAFMPVNLGIKGEGMMKVYLAKHFTPDPQPPRCMSMVAGTVYTVTKPDDAQWKDLKFEPISNAIEVPVTVQ